MADKPAKRRIRNPETFRERAVKATQEGEKPKRSGRLKRTAARATGPFKMVLRKIFDRQPFRLLVKPLRLIGKVLLPAYVRNSWIELKQVTWPNWKQSRQLTVAVLIFAIIFGVTVAGVDYVLDKAFRHIILGK
jgi:preprotein translocase SecE subunit